MSNAWPTVTDFSIDTAGAGDNAIVALPAPGVGFSWRILGFFMVGAGAVNARWKSAANNKGGAIPLAANTGVGPGNCAPGSGARIFQGGDNEAIILNLSAAVQVSGMGTAQKVPSGT
jgi:hypothetical protein